MENQQGTSFIPKSPTRASVKPKGVRQVFILTYVTSIFFFGTIIAAIVIFVWGATLTTQLEATKASLAEKKTAFNQQGLEQVREINTRLQTATSLFERQVSLLNIFTALEKVIYLPIQVTAFEYQQDNPGVRNLTLIIRARTFNDAVAQRDALLENPIFTGALVSTPTLSDPIPPDDAPYLSVKEITYTLEKELSQKDISYSLSEQENQITIQDSLSFFGEEQKVGVSEGSVTNTEEQTEPEETITEVVNTVPAIEPVDITDSITN